VASRYSRFVGLAFVVLVVVAVLNTLRSDDGGTLGIGEDDRGLPLAEFAVPDATGTLSGDANIAQDDCETSRNPCPDDQVRTPACEVDVEGALRVCDYFDRPLAISFWFTRGGDCIETQDAFDRVAGRYRGRANFLSVDVRDDPETVSEIVESRGWRVPAGYDADGAVANTYRVGVCPTIVLAYPGGILYDARIQAGNFTAAEIDDMVAELVAASRERQAATR
jgi:thiol-disulfide isomerase/thioredoxin